MSYHSTRGSGWIPDLPDARDYTARTEQVQQLFDRLNPREEKRLPREVDLRCDSEGQYFSEVRDQGPLQCSTAFAVLSLIEYFERRTRGRTYSASPMFLYKVTRNMRERTPHFLAGSQRVESHSQGDSGADLRTTLKTLKAFGVPDESTWPFEPHKFDVEPSAFAYASATQFPGIVYVRLGSEAGDTWSQLKPFLAAGFPIAFGFAQPASITESGDIPYRANCEQVAGGAAAVAIGYREDYLGLGQDALLIRTCWGKQWGDNGNGWLPTAFIKHGLARDFWIVVSEAWMDGNELLRPQI